MKKTNLLGIVVLLLLFIGGFLYFFRSPNDSTGSEPVVNHPSQSLTNETQTISEEVVNESLVDSLSIFGSDIKPDKKMIVSSKNATFNNQEDTLNLRDFGVVGSGKNETTGFQKALYAAAGKVLYIPKQKGEFYLTRQLQIPSNSTLVFDHQVVVQATDDLKQAHADFEVLFRIENANNVIVKGNNALLRMNKSAYKGEHNHIFMINGSSNVEINKVRANNSGGDGFYIGAYKTSKKLCENIKIVDCVADYNRRQGLSIISVKNFLAERCRFDNTRGASPASGVDIEPNNNNDILENIRFINCSAKNNQRRGFMVQLSKFTSPSKLVDISFINCTAEGNLYGFASMYFNDNIQGSILFEDCEASKSKYAGFVEESCSSLGVLKKYYRCVAYENNLSGSTSINSNSSDFYIYNSDVKKRKTIGNSVFENCISGSSTVQNGISVRVTNNTIPKNIEVNGFAIKGGAKNSVVIPSTLSKSQNIVVK